MKRSRITVLVTGAVLAATPAIGGSTSTAEIYSLLTALPVSEASSEAISSRCNRVLALTNKAKSELEKRSARATFNEDFVAYDTLMLGLGDGYNEMALISQTNPDKEVRQAAETCVAKLSDLNSAISLSLPIYERLASLPTPSDAKAAFTLKKMLTNYRIAGVDKDAATRAKVAELQKEITEVGLAFAANIRDDTGDIKLRPEELAGLPQDYLSAHKAGADGFVHLTYDYPDIFPVLEFASNRETRKKVMTAFLNRAWPTNAPVLKSLLEKRYALAQTLGYPDYATLVTTDKMIGDPQRAGQFLDEINAAAQPSAEKDMAELLAFAKTVDPSITELQRYDTRYFSNLLRKEKYAVDAAEVRQYFTYDKTRQGIFGLISDLFGADFRPWNTKVWADGVTAWELYDKDGTLVGRFYLDMHPREGKFNHAAMFPVRTGIAGKQIPTGALVANMPASGPMDHQDVVTFLHEFGHLIHNLYSGRTQYGVQSMGNLQWDFIEAPSQLLEEWVWDYDTLRTFASNPQGDPIPQALVEKMNAGRRFGQSEMWKRQLALAAVSLNYYNRAPDFDLKDMYDAQSQRYVQLPLLDAAYEFANFGHLDGYSAIYYTYIWSKAIALDLFTAFEKAGLRDPHAASRYRKLVLEPGGSQDANVLIHDLLGRNLSLEAFKAELQK
ncbi:MAG TPA: M3 family metallopeptidase [Pedomonas sp.]|uniref:M3 family metallopeptidase n=1 Tax=Pedomonas sp. TaxID=2976421 RepID=UPI002F3EDC45